ncbi:PD-(D/E)XK nuclease family protein [Opitutaceae bacterium TAV4]|nr:PD-(D/E)XK nuclease family protein [Opitutaceae bacterium TAV4]RRJ98414.1 PD-(D/E)XK nuclease family protein [Opitutaceae bacterium TAV3]
MIALLPLPDGGDASSNGVPVPSSTSNTAPASESSASHATTATTATPVAETAVSHDPLEYVSVSRLKSFLTCRLKFYFEKVLALPRPVSPSLHFGKAVHEGLQHFNKARWRDGDFSETAVLAAFNRAFANPDDGQPVEWTDDDERAELQAKGEALLRAFLESNLHLPADIGSKPLGVEVKLSAELPGLSLPLLGVIDLVKADRTPVDYKTIAQTPNLENETWQHELQLTAYTLLIEDATGETCPGNELVFLVKTKTPKVIRQSFPAPTQIQRDRFARLVDIYANGVELEHYYPASGQHCAWCPFRKECSQWTGGSVS